MIWKTEDISQQARQGKLFIRKQIYRQIDLTAGHDSTFSIGIVGGGPKGLYALEELLSRIRTEEFSRDWQILWWNSTESFGSGPNYQVDQPDYLLINYCIGHVDAWDRARSTQSDQLNLMDWIQQFKTDYREVKPTDFASRALVGYYLQYVAMQVISSKPHNVRLQLIPEKVRNIKAESKDKLWIQTDTKNFRLDNVLLTTGHCYHNIPLVDFGRNSIPANYLTHAYPIQVLDHISPQKKVGVIGWGLTFIDVALQLTEGRGGYFDAEGNYIPSGNEPILFPFSRNQLPIMPRGPIFGEHTYQLHYLNQEWFAEMQSLQKQRKIDFQTDIFPWLEKEWHFAYYSTLLHSREATEVENYISTLSKTQRFNYRDLLFPEIPQKESLQKSYIDYLDFLLIEAEKGELKSPLMAAAAIWREVSPMMAEMYRAGGFTGQSQHYLDKELFGAFCRTSYGPPIENMRKINALLKANIIQVHWKTPVKITHHKAENHFVLESDEKREKVDFIVDARVARPNLAHKNSGLYQYLWENDLVEPYENEAYKPGCVKMNALGKVISSENAIPLYAYGSNTEGFLLDNDSLSRKKNNIATNWVAQLLGKHKITNEI